MSFYIYACQFVEYKLHLHCFFACCRNISHTYGSLVRIVTIICRSHLATFVNKNNFPFKVYIDKSLFKKMRIRIKSSLYILLDFCRIYIYIYRTFISLNGYFEINKFLFIDFVLFFFVSINF